MSAELDKLVLEARDKLRDANEAWMKVKNGSDVQARADTYDAVRSAERVYLELGIRRR